MDGTKSIPKNRSSRSSTAFGDLAGQIRSLPTRTGVILAGHGRYLAAQELGLSKVPVLALADLSEAEKRALALADNKIALNAGWDRKLVAQELGELADLLPECNLDLEITGFEPGEIDGLLGDLVDPELDPADVVPLTPAPAVTRAGDLWELGPHRLLCGDAQSTIDLRRLMGTEAATMMTTHPPYNIPIKRVQGRGRIKHGNFIQGSGEMSAAEFGSCASCSPLRPNIPPPAPSISSSWTGAT